MTADMPKITSVVDKLIQTDVPLGIYLLMLICLGGLKTPRRRHLRKLI